MMVLGDEGGEDGDCGYSAKVTVDGIRCRK